MSTACASAIRKDAAPFPEEQTRQIVAQFDRGGYVDSIVYSQRIIAQRLYPFIDYRMPEHVWEGADERLQRLLGRHKKGAYG